jgi:hypothetical protein
MRDPRYLIIDADPEKRTELVRLFNELGHTTDQPDNPRLANALLENTEYDCVLVDSEIPSDWSELMTRGFARNSNSPVFMIGPEGSEPPSAPEINSLDGYLHRNPDSILSLAEDIRKGIARIAGARLSESEAVALAGRKLESLKCTESLTDPRIFVRTSRIEGKGPREDIALAVDRGQGRYTMLLGDFTAPGRLAELEYLRLTHRIGCFLEESAGPDLLLTGLNAELFRSQPSIDFMTAVAVHVDLDKKKISHSLAGHLPLLHRRWGRRRWTALNGQGIPLGIRAGETYPIHETRLEPGDKILLLSDGFLKMRGPLGGIPDVDLAIGCIDDLPPDAAPHEVFEGIDDIVRNVTGGDIVADEITSMLIQI